MDRRRFGVRVRRSWWDRPLPTDPEDRERELARRARYDALIGYCAEQERAAEREAALRDAAIDSVVASPAPSGID